MIKIKGYCKNCVQYDVKTKYCSHIGQSVEKEDYCCFFVNKRIILRYPSYYEYYFYIDESGGIRGIQENDSYNRKVAHYNYDFSEDAALLRAQEQFINNKLHKLAEATNQDWNPDWKNLEESKWHICYYYDHSEEIIKYIIQKTNQNDYNVVYFQSEEKAKKSWEEIRPDVQRLYRLKQKNE